MSDVAMDGPVCITCESYLVNTGKVLFYFLEVYFSNAAFSIK